MHILREVEPEGLPIMIDAIKSETGEVLSLRMFVINQDESGVKYVREEFPLDLLDFAPRAMVLLQENKIEKENETSKEKRRE